MSEAANDEGGFAGSKLMEQLQQEHALAQIISCMPNNRDGGPDITVAAPIRAKWAHRLYQQGVRVHGDLATHQVVVHDSGIAGPHAPRSFEQIDKDKLLQIIQKQNPALYKKIKAVREATHGGEDMAQRILDQVLERLPKEWIEKLQPDLTAKTDDFAKDNIPDEDAPEDAPHDPA